ncbi:hypothetical protein [Curtobacterium luteum]|uniref:hypothetical protein n=1 Tax=Curtobacterium luteum TaxID=33881 RepID=UPI000A72F8CD|nr:hypothetical protein [Curtobacterium luteum]
MSKQQDALRRANLIIDGFVQHDWASSMSVHEWYRNELRQLRDAMNTTISEKDE